MREGGAFDVRTRTFVSKAWLELPTVKHKRMSCVKNESMTVDEQSEVFRRSNFGRLIRGEIGRIILNELSTYLPSDAG